MYLTNLEKLQRSKRGWFFFTYFPYSACTCTLLNIQRRLNIARHEGCVITPLGIRRRRQRWRRRRWPALSNRWEAKRSPTPPRATAATATAVVVVVMSVAGADGSYPHDRYTPYHYCTPKHEDDECACR